MTEHKTLRPIGGANVRRPDNGQYLATDGESVPMTSYWQRRVAAGEVEEVLQQRAKAKAAGKVHTSNDQATGE